MTTQFGSAVTPVTAIFGIDGDFVGGYCRRHPDGAIRYYDVHQLRHPEGAVGVQAELEAAPRKVTEEDWQTLVDKGEPEY